MQQRCEDDTEYDEERDAGLGTASAARVPDIEQMWLAGAMRYRRLTAQEEARAATGARICACCADGWQALVNHNLLLVPQTAKRWRLAHAISLEIVDLWQYGVAGLMKAAVKYDPKRHTRFSTCATWWIRQAITRSVVDCGYIVREPPYVFYDRSHARRTGDRYPEPIRPISLDIQIKDLLGHTERGSVAGEETLEAWTADPDAIDPLEAAVESDARHRLYGTMREILTKRERLVLALRFGLADQRSQSLEQVGRQLGVTRERVHQIEAAAIRKMQDALGAGRTSLPHGLSMAYSQVPAVGPPMAAQKRQRLAPSVSPATTPCETREPSPTEPQMQVQRNNKPTRRRAPSQKTGVLVVTALDASRVPAPSNEDKAMRVPTSRAKQRSTTIGRVERKAIGNDR